MNPMTIPVNPQYPEKSRGALAGDPDLHMITADPAAYDRAHPCDCEALCDCDNSTTVEASTEPRTDHPY